MSWFALILAIPWIVDSEIVKSKARDFVAEQTDGTVKIESIDLFWFPRPGVMIRNALISFDKDIEGSIQQLTLYPSIRQLLTGSFAVFRVTADGGAWKVRLANRPDAPLDLAALEEKMRAIVKNLALVVPGMNLQVRRGMADIRFADGAPLLVTDIDASLGVTQETLALTMTAGANVAERIRLSGELTSSSLASEAQLSVAKLDLRKLNDVYSPAAAGWITDGLATLTVKFKAVGLRSVSAEVGGLLPTATLARGSRKAPIEAQDFKATVSADEKAFRVAVASLNLVSPPLKAAGEVVFDRPTSLWSVLLTGRDLNVGAIRKSALLLAEDVTGARNLFRFLQDGSIADIRVETRGRSIAEALESEQALVTANLRGVKVFVPGPALDLAYVDGAVTIRDGVLECKKCAATLGKAKGRDGALRVGLAGSGAPFHLDILVEADARELQSLLVRHINDEAFRGEVAKFRDVEGSLSGRLVLGESLDAISVQVSAVQPKLTATYEAVPYPVSLTGGRFNYGNGKIETEGLEGSIGRSSFAGLSGSVGADRAGRLDIKSASLQLELQEIEVLLRKVESLGAKLGPDSAARGKINFASISLRGPVNDPSRWNFSGKGKVEDLWIKHGSLPDPIAITQGSFEASPDKITFAKIKAEMLDASMTAGGVVNNWRTAPLRVEATGNGVAGQRMVEWLQRQSEISPDYLPRSPLEFSDSRIVWRDKGEMSFKGQVTVAQGPRLSIDLSRSLGSFTINDLSLDDAGQSARGSYESDADNWKLAFRGTLDKQTLDRLFLTARVPIGLLRGDFAVNVSRKPPYRMSARGALSGKDIVASLKGEDSVIEQFDVQGDQATLNIGSADLRWRRSRISLSGKVTAAQDALQVDMDVSADRLVWEEINAIAGTADNQKTQGKAQGGLPALMGVVRVKSERVDVGAYSMMPLQLVAQFTADGINGEISDSAVCGIRTAGRFTVQKQDRIEVDLRLSAKDGALDATTRCLSSDKSNVSGTYSLDARLTGRGSGAQLAQSLSGQFDLSARDGKVITAKGVDAAFDYLNDTGDFKVAFPDLDKEAWPYSLISAKGTVAGESVIADELIIEASPYAITVQGKADFERKSIDGKGLVTVLLPAGNILKSIPLVGSIVSGSIIGIPIEVTGTLDQPQVSYLSPAALGAEVINLPLRILKLPLGMLQIFTPRQPEAVH